MSEPKIGNKSDIIGDSLNAVLRDYLISEYHNTGKSYSEIAEKRGIAPSTVFKYLSGQTKTISVDVLEAIIYGLGLTPERVFSELYGLDKESQLTDVIISPDDKTVFEAQLYEKKIEREHDLYLMSSFESTYHKQEIAKLEIEKRKLITEKWIYFGVMMAIVFAIIAYLVWDINSPNIGIFKSMMLGV